MNDGMASQAHQEMAPPNQSNLIDTFIALRASGAMTDQQFYAALSAVMGTNAQPNAYDANDIESGRIQLRLAGVTEFRGDRTDFYMAPRWISAIERDLGAIGLPSHQWSLACFRKMPLDSPASLWAESLYGNGGTFSAPEWHVWKTSFLGQFMDPNELQAAQSDFNRIHMNAQGSNVLEFNEAFRAAAVRLDYAYKANKITMDADHLVLQYLTKLTGAVAAHVNLAVTINAASNRDREREGRPEVKLTLHDLMSEAAQHQKDVSLRGAMGGGYTVNSTTASTVTPMDLDVIETTDTTELDENKEIKANVKADLNAPPRTEFLKRGCGGRREPAKDKDSGDKKEVKCYNCGGLGHIARHCKKKREVAKKGQDQ